MPISRLQIGEITQVTLGGPVSILSELVTKIDKQIEELSNATDEMVLTLAKYSSTNQTRQYGVCVSSVLRLNKSLFNAAHDFNDVQHQIVKFHNKIDAWNDRPPSAPAPRMVDVRITKIDVNSASNVFNILEMKEVRGSLTNYIQNVRNSISTIKREKEDIGTIWRDRQYNMFSIVIDEISTEVLDACILLEEYRDILHRKITDWEQNGGM